jgi:hypothetical protein
MACGGVSIMGDFDPDSDKQRTADMTAVLFKKLNDSALQMAQNRVMPDYGRNMLRRMKHFHARALKLAKRDGGYDDGDDGDDDGDDDDDANANGDDDANADADDSASSTSASSASRYQLNQIQLLNADRASMPEPSASRLNKMYGVNGYVKYYRDQDIAKYIDAECIKLKSVTGALFDLARIRDKSVIKLIEEHKIGEKTNIDADEIDKYMNLQDHHHEAISTIKAVFETLQTLHALLIQSNLFAAAISAKIKQVDERAWTTAEVKVPATVLAMDFGL